MRLAILILLSGLFFQGCANDSTFLDTRITAFDGKFLHRINAKISAIDGQLDWQTEKYLQKLSRQEARLKKKLYKLDSNATKTYFYPIRSSSMLYTCRNSERIRKVDFNDIFGVGSIISAFGGSPGDIWPTVDPEISDKYTPAWQRFSGQ
jgi:hypothetical protein